MITRRQTNSLRSSLQPLNIPCRTHRVPKTRQYGSASTRCRETLSTVTIRSQVTYSPGDGALFEYEIGTGQELQLKTFAS